MKKQWQIAEAPPSDFFSSLAEINPILAGILWNRGLHNAEAARAFLSDDIDPALVLDFAGDDFLRFYNPFLFRDMQAAVDLIISHLKAGNKMVV